ncbi:MULTISPECIES: NusA N-terminal domain-containing protein [unclassified Mycoplasma]|uniref:NusA N-terminal domain-containing protein n=1 Tax=unclassified Mycoplasma TaxID=2683645 RepID=UPI00211C4065|nr:MULTISPECIES: NusA N-terminal domain-containing protein [unclassified Mycoplasma]UUM19838.1 transcription termination/antitermination protein NusA [Mycoplasma sp. 1578d]UUM24822.1 transcription termination/antitermination protein NusA [Mycoplasma sp. 3686d]
MAKKTTFELTVNHKWYLIATGYANKHQISLPEVLEIFSFETTKAINKDIDPEAQIVFTLDEKNEEVIISNINGEVVENDFIFEDTKEALDIQRISFIPLAQARKINPKVSEGDNFAILFDFEIIPDKTKVAIKNGFYQNFKITEKQKIYQRYLPLVGNKLKAEVLSRNSNGSYNLRFEDGVTAFLPASKVNKSLDMNLGSYLDVYLEHVNPENRLSICEVTTDSPNRIRDLVLNEIPEIQEGLLQIVKIERNPGVRTKISLKATESSTGFDPFGSIFGEGAKRILAISQKLNGEKIEIIKYSTNIYEYIKNALSPAKVLDVVEDKKTFYAIVDQEEMKNAIGKGGSNIDLAIKITNSKIKILTVEEAHEKEIDFNPNRFYEKHEFVRSTKQNPRDSKRNRYFEGIEINMSEFSDDVAQFNENQKNNSSFFGTSQNKPKSTNNKPKTLVESELDDLFSEEALSFDLENDNDYDFVDQIEFGDFDDKEQLEESENTTDPNSEKPVVKAYKNAKVELKDFKVDSDLANYGLDLNLNIDLSGFEDEWEKKK